MTYASGCKCHGTTFCPDLICIGMDDDVPVFVRRDSEEGRAAVAYQAERKEREQTEVERLRAALAQCAAPFDTGPTTLSMAPHIISTEFQRRMNIAAMALTAGERE
jgi:hypothetical protein